MNRQELIESYIDHTLDILSIKDLISIVSDELREDVSRYTDDQLISAVQQYNPELRIKVSNLESVSVV